jgi:CO/xanthine dehydrogenase Mo-binding subunit
MKRRDFLKAGGAVVVTFGLADALASRLTAQTADTKPLELTEVDSFLAVHADGTVTIYSGKIDCGTGHRIAVAQMVAEELGVAVGKIKMIDGDTGVVPDQGSTGGSTGLTRGGSEIRQAAATARQGLLQLAAQKLNLPAAELMLANGRISPRGAGASVTIAELIGGKRTAFKMDANAPLKPPAGYTIVGQPLLRPDVAAKVTARHTYVQDHSVPGMLHGRVIRPGSIGSKLVSIDETSIAAIPDVRVVRVKDFLGVVARDEWAAIRAARELKVTWSDWQGLPGSAGLEASVRRGPMDRDQQVLNRGDAPAAMAAATKKVSATFLWPNQSHASMGPSCAVADVHDGGATVWSSTQGPHALRQNLARVFALDAAKTRVVFLDGAGSYGSNGNDDVAADAVLLSKTVGAPVRVQWMRHDEHGWDPKGPQQLLDVRAGMDAQGKITAWETEMWVPTNKPGQRMLPAAEHAGLATDSGQGAGLMTQNGEPPYEATNVRVTAHLTQGTPLRISNLRAPGKIANVFAVEAMVDQLAAAAGADPIAFRQTRIKDIRAIAALQRVKEMLGWDTRPSPNPNALQGRVRVGRGMAYMRYKQSENYVAVAMAVSVDPATGKITVRRVACAHDCGLIVNPNALRNQIEGCIVQTLSRTLFEEVKFDASRVTSVDWVSYPILTFPDAPEIDVALLNHPEEPLMGAGEAAAAPVAAALANAVFDATGVLLTTVPFTVDRVKAALAGKA